MVFGLRACTIALALACGLGCACTTPVPVVDSSVRDADLDATHCTYTDYDDGLLRAPDGFSYIGPRVIAPRGASASLLRVGYSYFDEVEGTRVTAGSVDRSAVSPLWSVPGRFGRLGSVRWNANSVMALVTRTEGVGASLVYRHAAVWKPVVTEPSMTELRIFERWPYGRVGACGPTAEQFVPTPSRLWFVRYVQCPDDPESGSSVLGRLHAFAPDGSDVTPEEGIPMAQVFYGSAYSPTIQEWSDDGIAYLVRDEGSGGVGEPDAMHWERRDANGVLVARSGPLVPGAELERTGNVWMEVVDDTAFVYMHLASAPGGVTSYLAKIEADGRVAWSHRFEGYEANTSSWRSRVEVFEGGLVALLAPTDLAPRSVVRIAEDGTLDIAPEVFVVGTEFVVGVAVTADTDGVTVFFLDADSEGNTVLSRYEWNGRRFWENVLEDTRSGGFWDFLRADDRGGSYLLSYGGLFQHFDAFGRPAAVRRQHFCPDGPPVRDETIPVERAPIDAGIDAHRFSRDAWTAPLDAATVDIFDAESADVPMDAIDG